MKKKTEKPCLLATILCLALLLTSCVEVHLGDKSGRLGIMKERKLKPSSHLVDTVCNVAPFDELEVDIVASVKWIQSVAGDYRVVLRCPDNYVDLFQFSVDDNELSMSFAKKNVSIDAGDVKVLVYAPTLSKIKNKGVSSVRADSVRVDRLDIDNDAVGNIELSRVSARRIDAENNGVGSIKLSGTAEETELECNGVGAIDAKALQATAVKAEVNGVGGISCWVTERLNGEVNGVGSLKYKGNPQMKRLAHDGVGNIKHID